MKIQPQAKLLKSKNVVTATNENPILYHR